MAFPDVLFALVLDLRDTVLYQSKTTHTVVNDFVR